MDFMQRGRNAAVIMRRQGVQSEDAIFISSIWPHYSAMLHMALPASPTYYFDVMEWFQPYQFRGGKLSLWYQMYNHYFNYTAISGRKVMVISDELRKHYTGLNKEVLCLPIVLNPDDYPCYDRDVFSPVLFIYPGNPSRKDAFAVMLKALALLTPDERKRIRFHITGVTRQTLENVLQGSAYLLDELRHMIEFHGWLDYMDLYHLYNRMHFFLLAKEETIVSRANFPSKVPELMSCGVVPVMNNVGDIAHYLTNGVDSILYDACDPAQCVDAIRKAVNLPEGIKKDLSRNARKCATEYFNYKLWREWIADFFSD